MSDDRIEPDAFEIGEPHDGRTLADVVRRRMTGRSWNHVRGICRRGHVCTDGVVTTDPAARVKLGQRIEVHAKPQRDTAVRTVELMHIDGDVVVVDKPAGLISVPFEGEHDTLLHHATTALRRKTRKPIPMLRVVQRLDIDTTGVLVFARNRRAERHLQQQFRVHSVDRRYRALVLGRARDATFSTPIVRNRGDGLRGKPRRGAKSQPSKDAVTHVEVLDVFDVPSELVADGSSLQVSYVECRLETGRQHQIRIHLSEAGHPLVGERVYVRDYRGPKVRGFADGQGRPLLHAARLGFAHPSDEGPRAFVRPLPEDFATLLDQLGQPIASEDPAATDFSVD